MSDSPPSPPPSGAPWAKIIAGVLALLIGTGITIAVTDDPGPDGNHHPAVTITLGGQGHQKIVLTAPAQAVATAQASGSAGSPIPNGVEDTAHGADLRGPVPSAAEIQQGNKAAPPQPSIPTTVPQASPSAPGCVSTFVRNQSSRNGAKVTLGVIHWTGSRSLPNSTADDLGIVRWFDLPAAQASSNYVADDDGHCYYIVPETAKAWTQAAANPWAVSVEYVNPGVLPLFHGAAGRARVIALMRGWHRRWGIPYQLGAVNSSCVPIRAGFLAHRDLGPCGGGHPDVGVPSVVPSLIREAAAGQPRPVTARDRHDCRKIDRFNKHRGAKSARWTRVVAFRRARVHSHHLYCKQGRVVRR